MLRCGRARAHTDCVLPQFVHTHTPFDTNEICDSKRPDGKKAAHTFRIGRLKTIGRKLFLHIDRRTD